MDHKLLKIDDTEIENYKLHQHKYPISISNIDINKMLVPIKVSLGKDDFEYFICHKDGKKFRPLFILLPKMSAYRRNFYETFLIKSVELLGKYN